MYFKVFVLILTVCFYTVEAGLADFITPCKSSDSACLKQSAQAAVPIIAAGIPALGVDSLDPMHISRIKENNLGLNMDFKNLKVTNLGKCLVDKISRRGDILALRLKCDVVVTGLYKLNGRLIIMPIKGDGDFRIDINEIVVSMQYKLVDYTGADGQPHWRLTETQSNYDVVGNAKFNFNNLFNGNKQLAEAVHKFANENWHTIFKEVAPPVVKAILTKTNKEIDNFFSKVPNTELYI